MSAGRRLWHAGAGIAAVEAALPAAGSRSRETSPRARAQQVVRAMRFAAARLKLVFALAVVLGDSSEFNFARK